MTSRQVTTLRLRYGAAANKDDGFDACVPLCLCDLAPTPELRRRSRPLAGGIPTGERSEYIDPNDGDLNINVDHLG